jgi:hypothetical protein
MLTAIPLTSTLGRQPNSHLIQAATFRLKAGSISDEYPAGQGVAPRDSETQFT